MASKKQPACVKTFAQNYTIEPHVSFVAREHFFGHSNGLNKTRMRSMKNRKQFEKK